MILLEWINWSKTELTIEVSGSVSIKFAISGTAASVTISQAGKLIIISLD